MNFRPYFLYPRQTYLTNVAKIVKPCHYLKSNLDLMPVLIQFNGFWLGLGTIYSVTLPMKDALASSMQ